MTGTKEELWKLVKKFDVAMLVTHTVNGGLRGRPLAIQQHAADQSLWLATSDQSDKVRDISGNADCAVICHDGEKSPTYVSMSGLATIVRDPAKVRELWRPSWRLWFPNGPEEEDIVLLRFEPTHAEYATPVAGKLGVMVSAVKRLITKKHPPKGEKAEVDV